MAAWITLTASQILFLFLLINYNYAEETIKEPTSKINADVLKSNVNNSTYLWEDNVELESDGRIRRSRDRRHIQIRLVWFDKYTDALVGSEYSRDLGNDGTVIEQLGISIRSNVNNRGYNVQSGWVGILQNYFNHRINLSAFHYQVSFHYRKWWEDMRVLTFDLFHTPSWRKENGNIYIYLTPGVSGRIVRATYRYFGHNFPNTMIRIHLLGTSFDCWLNPTADTEFYPAQKQLVNGQSFEIIHSTRATQTHYRKFEQGKPLQVIFKFAVLP